MNERDLHDLIRCVRSGRMPRRDFIQRMAALGVSAPLASMMLSHHGVARAQMPPFAYKGTKRGGGGVLKALLSQGPTLLHPHFTNRTKDQPGSRPFYEPLARLDYDGE